MAWVDVVWSFMVGINAIALILLIGEDSTRNLVLAGCIGLWSLRLGTTLLQRARRHSEEDGRYVRMLGAFGSRPGPKLALFYLAQATVSWLFAVPVAIAAMADHPQGFTEIWAVAVTLLAVSGEALSDAQLAAFRKDGSTRGQVCRRGLWAYSRHPNYFFEWLHWWAYVPMAWSAPAGWLVLIGPVVMYLFLNRVSGIPYTEMQALASRGEAYARYQREVSAFFPWFPKRSSEA